MKKNKKQVISEEKSFKNFLRDAAPIYGVFGYNGYIENGQFVTMGKKFMMFDENLKVIFENKPYDKNGNYHKNVEVKLKEIKINEDKDLRSKKIRERVRTDNNIEDMIFHILVHHSLEWIPWNMFEGEGSEDYDIEPSSPEWENLEKVRRFYSMKRNLLSEKCRDNSLDKKSIRYNLFTDKGKKDVDEAIEWFKINKSLTPLQDAWMAVLRKDGVNVDWEPNIFALDDKLIMKDVDYSTREELEEKDRKEDEEFKKSLTAKQKRIFNKAIENLNKKR